MGRAVKLEDASQGRNWALECQPAQRTGAPCLSWGSGHLPLCSFASRDHELGASGSQAAKGQGVLGVVGTGMQIRFEGPSLLKDAENVDLCDMSCFLNIVKLRKTYKFRSESWFWTLCQWVNKCKLGLLAHKKKNLNAQPSYIKSV